MRVRSANSRKRIRPSEMSSRDPIIAFPHSATVRCRTRLLPLGAEQVGGVATRGELAGDEVAVDLRLSHVSVNEPTSTIG